MDIVGSTAYKQTSRATQASEDPVEKWVTMVTHFYRDFSIKFLTECQRFESQYSQNWEGKWRTPEEPSLWKVAGDELIYCVTLTDYRFAALFLAAWASAIKSVRPTLQQDYSKKLNLKASAWLAGFPINNTEVIIGLGKHNGVSLAGSHSTASDENMLKLNKYYSEKDAESRLGEVVDFIGPSLDIGFRLGGFATPRRLICSVELAWLVCKALNDKSVRTVRDLAENCEDNDRVFHISERQALKGVLDSVPYPMIWVDIGENNVFNKIEDGVLGAAPLPRDNVIEYCEAFISSCDVPYLFLPFIAGESSPDIKYTQKYEMLLSKWDKVQKDHEDASPPLGESPASEGGKAPESYNWDVVVKELPPKGLIDSP